MEELDRLIDIRDATLEIKTTQIATVLAKYESAKKLVTDEMALPGNAFMDWVKDVDFLIKTFDELNALFIKKEKDDSEFIRRVAETVDEIEAEKERVQKVEKMLYTMADKLGLMKRRLQQRGKRILSLKTQNEQFDKALAEERAELKKVRFENKRLLKGLPPEKIDKEVIVNNIKRETLTYNVKKASDKYSALDDIQRWDIKKYPPRSWPDDIDFLPPDPNNIEGVYPSSYDEKRLFIEHKLLELDRGLWPTEEFLPTPRVKAADAGRLPQSYGLCVDCGLTIKKVAGAGVNVTRCSKCRARYKRLLVNNSNSHGDTGRMFEGLTGLNYNDFIKVFGKFNEVLPESHATCSVNNYIRKVIAVGSSDE